MSTLHCPPPFSLLCSKIDCYAYKELAELFQGFDQTEAQEKGSWCGHNNPIVWLLQVKLNITLPVKIHKLGASLSIINKCTHAHTSLCIICDIYLL